MELLEPMAKFDIDPPKVHLAQKENDFVKVFSQAANGRIGNKLSLAF